MAFSYFLPFVISINGFSDVPISSHIHIKDQHMKFDQQLVIYLKIYNLFGINKIPN